MSPIYQFEDTQTGELVEELMPVDRVPQIGGLMRRGGRKLRRLPSEAQRHVQPDCAHVAHSIHENHPHAPHKLADGTCVFHTRREIREFEAKTGMKYD